METFFLVLKLYNASIAIIPEKYNSEKSCTEAGKRFNDDNEYSTGRIFYCIPAPKDDYYNCATNMVNLLNPSVSMIVKSHCDLPISSGNK